MRILITGAAGMVGRKLIARLAKDGTLRGHKVTALDLHDIVPPQAPAHGWRQRHPPHRRSREAGAAERLVASRPDVISISRASCRARRKPNFDLGYRVNLDGTRRPVRCHPAGRLCTARRLHLVDRGVRRTFPDVIQDDFHPTPLTSYGTQKQMSEALLADYSRRGFLRWHRHPAANHLRAARQAQQGGLRLLLRHHPRTTGRHEAILPVPRSSCTPMPAHARRSIS